MWFLVGDRKFGVRETPSTKATGHIEFFYSPGQHILATSQKWTSSPIIDISKCEIYIFIQLFFCG